MTTFEEARKIVREALLPEYPNIADPIYVAEWGGENETWWDVPVGSAKWLVEFNQDFMPDDDSIYLVNKKTGEFKVMSYLEDPAFVLTLKPYGDVPKFFR